MAKWVKLQNVRLSGHIEPVIIPVDKIDYIIDTSYVNSMGHSVPRCEVYINGDKLVVQDTVDDLITKLELNYD